MTYGGHAARRATSTKPPVAAPRSHGPSPVTSRCAPRGVQTWLLAGLAAFMLLIMFVVGRPEAPARRSGAAGVSPSADRVRDYQDRLRARVADAVAMAAQQTAPVVDPRASASRPRRRLRTRSHRRGAAANTRACLPATSS